ncbi:hypothetical protein SYNPS1DRAFT_23501, partial [Syncephalis pseudoplumigaleata]
QEQAKRAELGEAGLALLADTARRAIDANKVDVPAELIAAMPAPPSVDRVPQLASEFQLRPMDNATGPFAAAQLITADTLFTHLQIGLPIAALPQHLRPWLVLFQSLMFESPLTIHGVMADLDISTQGDDDDDDGDVLDYREVATGMARDLVSYHASVGYGNQLLGMARLSDYFVLAGSCEHRNYRRMLSWLLGGLTGMQYDRERVSTIMRNLLSDISEMQRNGSNMIEAVLARVTTKKQLNSATAHDRAGEHFVATNQNDQHISLFRQRAFLKGVLGRLQTPQGMSEITAALDDIKSYLLSASCHAIGESGQHELGGFLQIAAPSTEDHADMHRQFLAAWKSVARTGAQTAVPTHVDSIRGPFPAPRSPYSVDTDVQLVTPGGILVVPLSSITASYLACALPCDVLAPVDAPEHEGHREKAAVSILCELLSRVDGPIYEAVRGKGYAYGASVSLYSWYGQLVYSVSEAQDPARALDAFWRILERLETCWDSVCDEHALDAARATVAYHWFSRRSACSGVISAAINDAFRGFASQHDQKQYFTRHLAAVRMDDLKHVYTKYFRPFISGESDWAK